MVCIIVEWYSGEVCHRMQSKGAKRVRRSASHRRFVGLRVLVTRPAHQSEVFCRMIDAAGGRAIRLPVLEIVDPHDLRPVITQFKRLDDFDMAIFISANAVHKAVAYLDANELKLPQHLLLAAVGPSTANALKRAGYRLDLVPATTFTSESLLAMDEMHSLSGKDILIFRGEGGREVLAETLRARGARVEYVEVYRRTLPNIDRRTLKKVFTSGKLDLITVASVKALDNVVTLANRAGVTNLVDYRLLVGSLRIRSAAARKGFSNLIVAEDPSDQAMFSAIQSWIDERSGT